MKKRPIWKALFSQSGSEIQEISTRLGRYPDAIITNKPIEQLAEINYKLVEAVFDKLIFLPRKPTDEEYITAIGHAELVTLHGYLRILPSTICFRYNVLNGHPALISEYPELKGKDPQQRIWESSCSKYVLHGHVIHKAIAAVDEGSIVSKAMFSCSDIHDHYDTLANYIAAVHKVSVDNWVGYIKTKV